MKPEERRELNEQKKRMKAKRAALAEKMEKEPDVEFDFFNPEAVGNAELEKEPFVFIYEGKQYAVKPGKNTQKKSVAAHLKGLSYPVYDLKEEGGVQIMPSGGETPKNLEVKGSKPRFRIAIIREIPVVKKEPELDLGKTKAKK